MRLLLELGSTLKRAGGVGRGLRGDLLFCPFTAPFYAEPGVPTLSVIYDLQYAAYPQFFDPQDRAQRAHNFAEACRYATKLACISDYVRRTVLEHSGLPQERVRMVHIRLARRIAPPWRQRAGATRPGSS